jgi:uncharacterized protein YcbK (DUF882 family)
MKPTKSSSSAPVHHGIGRRDFLVAGLVAAAGCLFPYKVSASESESLSAERILSFYNTHTDENLKVVYFERGTYTPQALSDINKILRDFRTGEVKEIDTNLLDLLFFLQQKLESTGAFHVISGYRSPETNSLLSSMSKGVAGNSLHLNGKAIDIRLPGYDLKTLQRTAIELKKGGVGYYASSDFIHVDVGRIRYW